MSENDNVHVMKSAQELFALSFCLGYVSVRSCETGSILDVRISTLASEKNEHRLPFFAFTGSKI